MYAVDFSSTGAWLIKAVWCVRQCVVNCCILRTSTQQSCSVYVPVIRALFLLSAACVMPDAHFRTPKPANGPC